MRKSTALWLFLAALCSVILFHTSQRVTDGRQKIAETEAETQRELESIRVLTAEWDYLNQPARLEKLARLYLHLEPMKGRQFAQLSALSSAKPQPASAPEKTQVTEKVEEAPKAPIVKAAASVAPKVAAKAASHPVVPVESPVTRKAAAQKKQNALAVKTPSSPRVVPPRSASTSEAKSRAFGDVMKSLGVN